MPAADTVWPIPLVDLVAQLGGVGLDLRRMRDRTRWHRSVADALVAGFEVERSAIAAELGDHLIDDLVDAHRLWSSWLGCGRVRKLAVVAERRAGS